MCLNNVNKLKIFILYLVESCLIEYSWKPLLVAVVDDDVDVRLELKKNKKTTLIGQITTSNIQFCFSLYLVCIMRHKSSQLVVLTITYASHSRNYEGNFP